MWKCAAAGISIFLMPLMGIPASAAPVDVDKLHGGAGGWNTNWYDDLNGNWAHDPGEPFADSQQAGWGTPRSATDMSCWLATACNLLEQAGAVAAGGGAALYNNYALNGVVSPAGVLTWDNPGLCDYAITHFMNLNPGSGLVMNIHTWSGWGGGGWTFPNSVYGWLNWDPRAGAQNYLNNGWQVGIGMWPLVYAEPDPYHDDLGHCITVQSLHAGPPLNFDCTDSDRDWDWTNPGPLNVNNYNDATMSQVVAPNTYYGWYNDYYDGVIGALPFGDVGYLVAIVPEPATFALVALGGLVLLRRR